MSYKFTSDGRKVAVIGSLNAKETIVQEIFVTDDTEFPAGEHFVVKTLLDAPAETYKAKEEKRVEQRVKELERERDTLSKEISAMRVKMTAVAAKLKWTSAITDTELDVVFDQIKNFISGEITHIIFYGYEIRIEQVGIDSFAKYEHNHGCQSFDGIRLLSLFGECNGRLAMDWRMNSYRDGSGSFQKFIPCKSLQEAVEKAKEIIYSKDHLSDKDHEFCIKYGIPIDVDKNSERLRKKREYAQDQISKTKAHLAKQEADLEAIK